MSPSKAEVGKPWIFYEAKRSNFHSDDTSGKWCIVSKPEDVDKDWAIICALLDDGKLVAAKVSTSAARKITGHSTHVICVYTKDWTNKENVFHYRKVLEDAGFTENLGYKRDIDTMNPNPNFEFYYEA